MLKLIELRHAGRMVLAVAVAKELPALFVWAGDRCWSLRLK